MKGTEIVPKTHVFNKQYQWNDNDLERKLYDNINSGNYIQIFKCAFRVIFKDDFSYF